MAERMTVFEPGDRLATMSDAGAVRVYVVNEAGHLNDVTPGHAVEGGLRDLVHLRAATDRTEAMCDPGATGLLTDDEDDVTCGLCSPSHGR